MARASRTLPPPVLGAQVGLEYILPGPAISAQARNRAALRRWTDHVRETAQRAWPASSPVWDIDVFVQITEFSEMATRDRDNLAKPILDAMQGIAYINDRQVKALHVEWCDIEGSYVVRYMSPLLAAALSEGDEFLWVRVSSFVPRSRLT